MPQLLSVVELVFTVPTIATFCSVSVSEPVPVSVKSTAFSDTPFVLANASPPCSCNVNVLVVTLPTK